VRPVDDHLLVSFARQQQIVVPEPWEDLETLRLGRCFEQGAAV
jgi:hypothetical protein